MAASVPEVKQTDPQVVYVNYWYEPHMRSLDDLLSTYATLAHWTEAVAEAGVAVTVLQRFPQDRDEVRNKVRFVLRQDRYGAHLGKAQVPLAFHQAIRKHCRPEGGAGAIVHINSLMFPLQLLALRAGLPHHAGTIVQHHAERPAAGLRRRVQACGLRSADAFFFAACELALDWRNRGLIAPEQPVYEVMEGSTTFRRQDRGAARARTGLAGSPVVLWVGRLIELKDPLAVLRGFELVLRDMHGARLYMVYGDDTLLPDVRRLIAGSPALSASVTLIGAVPHADLEVIYNSADYFVLGSHYEGSGYALVEALACGVVPVVTDIASFRALTGQGRIGACWPPGDFGAFADAFRRVSRHSLPDLSDRAVEFFEEHLSWAAIARKAVRAYREVAGRRAPA